jgi:superfamily I DNA/RNA helicase
MTPSTSRPVTIAQASLARSLSKLAPQDQDRVWEAIRKFVADPNNPGLRFEKVENTRFNGYKFRASKKLRVLVDRRAQYDVIVDVRQHDDLYRRAERIVKVSNSAIAEMRYLELGRQWDGEEASEIRLDPDAGSPRLFDHWSDEELASAGLSVEQINAARGLAVFEDLEDLDLEWALHLVDLMSVTFAEWSKPVLDPEAEADARMLSDLQDFGVLAGFTRFLDAADAARLAAAPIEDWMVFLHPDQREVVLRRFRGPARVSGGPGTGKTVVALHRAAELASRLDPSKGQILFTTYVKTLTSALEEFYGRIPGAPSGRVEFVHVDALAHRFLRRHGHDVPLDGDAIDDAFKAALRRRGEAWQRLLAEGFTADYLREEVAAVIKGRGLTGLSQYLAPFQRTGRRTPLQDGQRRAVWALKEAWDEEMSRRGTVDFADKMRIARDFARTLPEPAYQSAIVDEVQDMTQVKMEFIHALVNPTGTEHRPDSLLVVGDGAQRIYSGGFRLLNAGIDVRGRTSVLRLNYRTTRQIMEAALAVAGNGEVEDLEEDYRRAEVALRSLREGIRPSLRMFATDEEQLEHVQQRIEQLRSAGQGVGDILVAVPTNTKAKLVLSALKTHDISATELSAYSGRTQDAVKVGTYARSKGLEFKSVILPFLSEDEFPRKWPPGQRPDERAEERQLGLSWLFVAMTRARDALFISSGPNLLTEIQQNEALFEWV